MTKEALINIVVAASLSVELGILLYSLPMPGVSGASGGWTVPSLRKSEPYHAMKVSVPPRLFRICQGGFGGGRIAWTEEPVGARELELLSDGHAGVTQVAQKVGEK